MIYIKQHRYFLTDFHTTYDRLLQKAIFVHFLTSSFIWHICHLFDTVQKTALVSYRKLIQFRSIPSIVDDQMMVPTM